MRAHGKPYSSVESRIFPRLHEFCVILRKIKIYRVIIMLENQVIFVYLESTTAVKAGIAKSEWCRLFVFMAGVGITATNTETKPRYRQYCHKH